MATEQQFIDEGPSAEERFGGGQAAGDHTEDLTEDYEVPVYVISVAAELADLHPQTLRTYEREGLLDPHRTAGGTRRYSRADVDRLRFIRHLTQEQGLNHAGVRAVLDLGEKLEGARQRIRELEDMVRTLASRLQEESDGKPRYEIVQTSGREVELHRNPRRRRSSTRTRTA